MKLVGASTTGAPHPKTGITLRLPEPGTHALHIHSVLPTTRSALWLLSPAALTFPRSWRSVLNKRAVLLAGTSQQICSPRRWLQNSESPTKSAECSWLGKASKQATMWGLGLGAGDLRSALSLSAPSQELGTPHNHTQTSVFCGEG